MPSDTLYSDLKKRIAKAVSHLFGIAFSLKQIDDKQYTKIIKPLADEIHKNRGELADAIIYYFITNDISDKFVVPLISYKGIGEKIPYPYFLQSIYEKFQGLNVGIFKQQVLTESSNVQDLKKLVCKMLLFSVQEKTIDVTTCSEILQQSLKQNTITMNEFQEVLKISCKDGWLTAEIVMEILHQNLENKLDNGNDFQAQMITLLLDEKIKEDVLHLQVKYFIVNTNFGWNEEKWIKLVFDLKHENSLYEKKCLDLLQTIITKYKITEDYLKRILTTPAFKHSPIPKKIIKKVNFKQVLDDDPERSKLLGKDAEGEVFSKINKKNKHSDINDGITMTSIRKL
ncbi:hypothetical protein BSL78_18983 [Apostichopus japonicus]|uniref:Uncharacterized protein n=1 Tax=Stichopus japonicus TaxID=307972 RepID=A0A2G8K881_STIJA|nr:hypothetical protein BSL78_18983 [Apostichopus japonicus]